MRVSGTALKQAINTLIFTMHTVHIEYQTQESNREMNNILMFAFSACLQCFDAVGLAAGRASGL